MTKYIAQKLLATIPVMLLVSAGVFLLLQLIPGDPVSAMLGENATPEAYASLRRELGLDRPLPVQYLDWLGKTVRGDLGVSVYRHRPVLGEVLRFFDQHLAGRGRERLDQQRVRAGVGPHELGGDAGERGGLRRVGVARPGAAAGHERLQRAQVVGGGECGGRHRQTQVMVPSTGRLPAELVMLPLGVVTTACRASYPTSRAWRYACSACSRI